MNVICNRRVWIEGILTPPPSILSLDPGNLMINPSIFNLDRENSIMCPSPVPQRTLEARLSALPESQSSSTGTAPLTSRSTLPGPET